MYSPVEENRKESSMTDTEMENHSDRVEIREALAEGESEGTFVITRCQY